MTFTEDEARGLVGARLVPLVDPVPYASCGRVVGAVLELGGWALVVAGRIRGVDVLLSCSREDMALLEVERWNA